ncbi:MAG: cupin domain-containing protein [Caulobacteraceae bacterium]
MDRDPVVSEIIQALAMERHPAAGWVSAHYRENEIWGRANLSSGYHLLIGDEPLPLHKVDGIEIWHHYRGAPVEIVVSNGGRRREVSVLGCDFSAGQRSQLAVPAYHWQSCRSLGAWSLLGSTMSPGYSQRGAIVMDASN